VVADTLNFNGNGQVSINRRTTVDLPTPEGPEMMTIFPDFLSAIESTAIKNSRA
jgi:hypothetical protein